MRLTRRFMKCAAFSLVATLLTLGCVKREAQPARDHHPPDVLYEPTPQEDVELMLSLAQVTKDDIVYDLGCGDGRFLVTAAKKYGCKAFGFDVDPAMVQCAELNVRQAQVQDLVTIRLQDIFTVDLSPATVVTLFLLPHLNVKLIPQLQQLKPGSRIVSYLFDMRGIKPAKVIELPPRDNAKRAVYLWVTPLQKEPGLSQGEQPKTKQ